MGEQEREKLSRWRAMYLDTLIHLAARSSPNSPQFDALCDRIERCLQVWGREERCYRLLHRALPPWAESAES